MPGSVLPHSLVEQCPAEVLCRLSDLPPAAAPEGGRLTQDTAPHLGGGDQGVVWGGGDTRQGKGQPGSGVLCMLGSTCVYSRLCMAVTQSCLRS
jgi:hypothetical protein